MHLSQKNVKNALTLNDKKTLKNVFTCVLKAANCCSKRQWKMLKLVLIAAIYLAVGGGVITRRGRKETGGKGIRVSHHSPLAAFLGD